MIVYNKKAIETGIAKTAIIKTHISGLAELSSFIKQNEVDTSNTIYISLFDKKVAGVPSVLELREAYSQLEDIMSLGIINIWVDEVNINSNGKYITGLIFSKLFGKDSSLWGSRGVYQDKFNQKWICGYREDSVRRECRGRGIVDSEFVVDLSKIEIREVTTLDGLKDLNNFLKDTDEVLFDIETNSLRYDSKDSEILCLQFGKRSEPYISYVVWYNKTGVDVEESYKKYVKQLVERIAYSKDLVAHNGSSFDIPWIAFKFDLDPLKIRITDTLVLTYIARNSTRKVPMDLKTITYPIMSDYDIELDTFKDNYCKENKIKKEEFTYDLIPKDILVKYSAWDITALAFLLPQLINECKEHIAGDLYDRVFLGFYKEYCSTLAKMSINGVPFNLEKAELWKIDKEAKLGELKSKLENDFKINETENKLRSINFGKAIKAYDKKVEEALAKGKEFKGKAPTLEDGKYGSINFDVKFNPSSADHKRVLFYDILGLKPLKETATGNTSVDSDTALKLAAANPDIEVLGLFDSIAKLEKEISSFYLPYIEMAKNSVDGRIRGSYKINGTLTGRLSQSAPNLLQIPSKSDFKYLIGHSDKSDYYIIGCDVTNLEGNIATMLSGDEALYEIKDYANGDAHSYMGISLRNKGITKFKECKEEGLDNRNADDIKFFKDTYPKLRHIAKTANFSCIFGIGGAGLAADLGISYQDGCDIVEGFWQTHWGLKNYFDEAEREAKEKGYVQSEDLGLALLTPDANHENDGMASASIRTSNNFKIQNYSFITHKANIWFNKKVEEEKLDAKAIVEVHDCLYVEAHKKDLARACVLVEQAMTMKFRDNQPYLLESPSEIGRTMKGGYEIKGGSIEDKINKVEEWLKEN